MLLLLPLLLLLLLQLLPSFANAHFYIQFTIRNFCLTEKQENREENTWNTLWQLNQFKCKAQCQNEKQRKTTK